MFDPTYASISALRAAMERRELSCRELTLFCLDRIARYDSCENGLNAVRQIDPDVLAHAEELDRRRAAGAVRSPLHGVPVLLKDNIDMTGLPTTAGAVALRDSFPARDAGLVRRLRAAGALILGKTNMSEMAHYMSSTQPSGCSGLGGQVRCPYDRAADPSGSSTGSAVAVAAGLCAAAVGTETCGSIMSPSSVNGVAGLKPTLGRVSRAGVLPISGTLDTPGPIARSAADAALLLAGMAGRDEADPATWGAEGADELTCGGASLRGVRIGVSRDSQQEAAPARRAAGERVLEALRAAGAVCVELPAFRAEGDVMALMRWEMALAVDRYLAALGPDRPVRTFETLLAWNRAHREAMPYGQDLLEQCDASRGLTAPDYLTALALRADTQARLRALLDEHRCTVMFSVAPRTVAALTGFPSLTIPAGTDERGMPVGSCFIARPWEDGALLRVGAALEQLLPPVAPPVL